MSKTSFAQQQLKSLVDRILRLKGEHDAIGLAIRDVYHEAYTAGLDKTELGRIVAEQRALGQGFQIYVARYDAKGLIKVGISRAPEKRVEYLGSGGKILLTFPGGFEDERTCHLIFAAYRKFGEWFELNAETLALVETLRVLGPLEALRATILPNRPHDPETGEIDAGDVPAFLRRQA